MKLYKFIICVLLVMLPGIAGSAHAQEEANRFAEIEGLIADGLYDTALERIHQFLADYPASPNSELVMYRLGTVQMRLNQYQQAVQTFRTWLERYPGGQQKAEVYLLLATALDATYDKEQALAVLDTLLNMDDLPEELVTAARDKRAAILLRHGDVGASIDDLRELVRRAPTPERRLRLADAYFKSQDYRSAERAWRDALETGSLTREQRRTAHLNRAVSLYQLQRYSDVVELLQPHIELYSDDRQIVTTYAWALHKLGRSQEAWRAMSSLPVDYDRQFLLDVRNGRELLLVHEYEAALQWFQRLTDQYGALPKYLPAWRGLAEAYAESGNLVAAAETLEKVAELEPDEKKRFRIWVDLGDIYSRQVGMLPKAATAYNRALSLRPNDPQADAIYARMLRAQVTGGDTAGARETILRFLAEFQKSDYMEEVLFNAGTVYENAGDFDRALEHYRKIAQYRGESPYRDDAYAAGLRIVSMLGRWQEAVSIAREYLREFPGHTGAAETYLTLASALYHLDRYIEGVHEATTALQLLQQSEDGVTAEALERLAWGLYKSGDPVGARERYNEIIQQFPESPLAEEAYYWRGWLAQVDGDLAAANNSFSRLADRFPQSGYAEISLYQHANNLLRQGATQQAVDLLRRLVSSYPDGAYAETARALLIDKLLELGRHQDALELMPLFVEANPALSASADSVFDTAEALADNGKYDQALAGFQRVIQEFPDSSLADNALAGIASIYFSRERYTQALETAQRLISQYPDSDAADTARYIAGQSLLKLRRYAEAVDQFETVLTSRGDDPRAVGTLNYLIGVGYEQQGDAEAAVSAYRRYLANLRSADEQLERRMEIAVLFMNNGYYDEAISQLRSIIHATNIDAMEMNAQYIIGNAYEQMGDLHTAAEEYLKVTYAHSANPAGALMARIRAGGIYEKLQRWEEAKGVYSTVARNHPNTRFGQLAAARIEAINSILAGEPEPETLPPSDMPEEGDTTEGSRLDDGA